MNAEILDAVIGCNEKMIPLLNEYMRIASVLLTLENDSAEEIAMLVHQREIIVDDLHDIKDELVYNINSIETSEAAVIKQMYNREPITHKLDADMAKIQSSVLNLISVQSEAVNTDERLMAQFSTRNSDVRDKLQALQQDRKKMNYYTKKVGTPKSGNYFDSIT